MIFWIFHQYGLYSKGIQILSNQFDDVDLASGYCSVMIALLMVICGLDQISWVIIYIILNLGLESICRLWCGGAGDFFHGIYSFRW